MVNIKNSLSNSTGPMFTAASVIFNLAISGLYIAVKLDQQFLVQLLGAIAVSMCLPFTATLLAFLKKNAGKKIIVSHVFILFYFLVEILLDYIFQIPFRDILYLHIVYIILFYAAAFSMIGVSFRISRSAGLLVTSTFLLLLGCLIFMYS